MDDATAQYIVKYFSHLMTPREQLAMRHHSSVSKWDAADPKNAGLIKVAREKRWLSVDPVILELLRDGYDQFEITAAQHHHRGLGVVSRITITCRQIETDTTCTTTTSSSAAASAAR